jgi:LmbE family N-acetylglucosaminyl deacetylase
LTPQSFIRLGRIRHCEAIKAAVSIGIPRSHLFFVSFPDGGMLQIAQSPILGKVFRSKRTLLSLASYPFAFVRNATYSKMVVVQLIRTILKRVRPRTIIMNLSNDTHPDHKAARLLTLDAIRGTGLKPFILSYLIHFPHFPKRGEFVPPQQLLSPRIQQLILKSSELRGKKRAFRLEPSQFNVSPLDRSLIRESEFFWVGSAKVVKQNFSKKGGSN